MNKKLLLAGAVAVVGFVTLTAFGGKTLEQQKAEIATAVTAKIEEFRAQKEEECTARVTTEAQNRFTQWQAEEEAAAAAKPGAKKPTGGKGKPTTKPSVTPLPQPQPPKPSDPKKDKMEGGSNTTEKQDKMQGQPNTDQKKKKMGGGN